MDVSSCSCDPDWSISIFVWRANRIWIGGVVGSKDTVDVGSVDGSDKDMDWETGFAFFWGEWWFSGECRRVEVA
jgi:hypothetical protein